MKITIPITVKQTVKSRLFMFLAKIAIVIRCETLSEKYINKSLKSMDCKIGDKRAHLFDDFEFELK